MKLESTAAWTALTLASLCLFLGPQRALSQQEKETTSVCGVLSLEKPGPEVEPVLSVFESAVQNGDLGDFVSLLHPSIIKSEDDKDSIFKNMMDSYDLKGKKLQRQFVYELKFGDSAQEVTCQSRRVTGVVGPRRQWAVGYTTSMTMGLGAGPGEQVRIFLLLGEIPQALRARSKFQAGLVHLHTQNWSFAGKTPDTLFKEATKWSLLDAPLAAWVYGVAAKRIVLANSYLLDERYSGDLQRVGEWEQKKDKVTEGYLEKKEEDTDLVTKSFTVVYRESQPEVGIKLETNKEIAVNDQIKQCRTVAKRVSPLFLESRKVLTGIECLIYRKGESMAGSPHGGSLFVTFADALVTQP